jgi:N-acetyl-alpha-D-glucosaminyl L-malate synthase BshA
MRIGIICHSSCGGSTRIALELAKHLARRRHRVHLFSQRLPFGFSSGNQYLATHFSPSLSQVDLHPSELKTRWSIAEQEQFLAGLIDVINREGLDILHFHYAVPFAFMAVELKRRLGPKCPYLVGTLHGTDVSIFARDPEMAAQLREALSQVDLVTTVSANHAALAVSLLGITTPLVVPNFLDMAAYRSHIRLAHALHERPRLIHISNFRPVKAPREMAEIFARLCHRLDAELWLVGDGPGLEDLKPFFEEQGVAEKVRYWGMQDRVGEILSQADLLLMTSLGESFCLVALEAMACGVPVVATGVGGLPEVVLHGETGFLFPTGNQALAVEYALQLLTNPGLHARFALAGQAQARNFDYAPIVSLYEELYRLKGCVAKNIVIGKWWR